MIPNRRKPRCCRRISGDTVFKPRSTPYHQLQEVELPLDQLEAVRLCDLEGLDQTEAGLRMGVSRGTVQRLLRTGRRTMVAALVHGYALRIRLEKEEFTDESVYPHCGQSRSGCIDS